MYNEDDFLMDKHLIQEKLKDINVVLDGVNNNLNDSCRNLIFYNF